MRTFVAVGAMAGALLGSCCRYEWIPDYLSPECQGFHRPLSTGPLEWETSLPDSGSSFRGRVVIADTHERLSDAALTLLTVPPQTAVSNSFGDFRFPSAPAGRFVLRTRRIGTRSRIDTVTVPLRPD